MTRRVQGGTPRYRAAVPFIFTRRLGHILRRFLCGSYKKKKKRKRKRKIRRSGGKRRRRRRGGGSLLVTKLRRDARWAIGYAGCPYKTRLSCEHATTTTSRPPLSPSLYFFLGSARSTPQGPDVNVRNAPPLTLSLFSALEIVVPMRDEETGLVTVAEWGISSWERCYRCAASRISLRIRVNDKFTFHDYPRRDIVACSISELENGQLSLYMPA